MYGLQVLIFHAFVAIQIGGLECVERFKRQSSCSPDQFACTTTGCVDSSVTCDGIRDCNDGTDETAELCSKIRCPAYTYRCAYGACIDKSYKCNGRIDCADGSDEKELTCPPTILKNNTFLVCRSEEFACTSGQCIDSTLACDGKKDCGDGSDETSKQCKNFRCPLYGFQCDYGGCIDRIYRCDGEIQCADGSDESDKTCQNGGNPPKVTRPKTSSTSTTTSSTSTTPLPTPNPSVPGSCVLPDTSSLHLRYTVTCPGSSCESGNTVSPYTVLDVVCREGFTRDGGNSFRAFCYDSKWEPEITECKRTCNPVISLNMDITCYYKGQTLNCTQPLPDGAKARPRCKSQYREEVPPHYRELTCEEGLWDNILFKCVPECGRPYTPSTTLIVNGTPERYGDSPWHVAIYDKANILICGGTIVTPYLVLSAAHCVFDRNNDRSFRAENYEIEVSKITRNRTIKDNENQQAYKVSQIHYSDRGYHGLKTLHAADIVLLEVSVKIVLSPTVLPACIEWTQTEKFKPPDGTPGKVVGWGIDNSGKTTGSEILLAATLPYISYETCLKESPETFRQYVTLDKFCAGSVSGSGVRQGDSGGGLLFQKSNSLYYVYGVVSIKDSSNISIAAFTDVSQHIEWLNTIKSKVDKQQLLAETTLALKLGK